MRLLGANGAVTGIRGEMTLLRDLGCRSSGGSVWGIDDALTMLTSRNSTRSSRADHLAPIRQLIDLFASSLHGMNPR